MKLKGLVVAVCIIALAGMGCGSSDSSTDGGGGGTSTAAPTSGQSLGTMTNASMWMATSAFSIIALVPPTTTSAKQVVTNVSCTPESTQDNLNCTIWDSQGSATSADHMCTISGSYALGSFHFDLAYHCVTFLADESNGTTVNGDWTARIYISPSFQFDESQNMSAGKVDVAKEDTSDCTYAGETASACGSSVSVDGGTCTVECSNETICQEAAALAVIDWTATSTVTVSDPTCGVTTTIGANTTSLTLICSATETDMTMAFDLNGTINTQAVAETVNVECTNIL